MNKVILIGRLTAKPELKYTSSNIAFTNFYRIIVTGSLSWTDSVFNQNINFLNDYENRLTGCAFRTSGIDKPAGIYIAIGT